MCLGGEISTDEATGENPFSDVESSFDWDEERERALSLEEKWVREGLGEYKTKLMSLINMFLDGENSEEVSEEYYAKSGEYRSSKRRRLELIASVRNPTNVSEAGAVADPSKVVDSTGGEQSEQDAVPKVETD